MYEFGAIVVVVSCSRHCDVCVLSYLFVYIRAGILMAEVAKSISNPYFTAYIVHCVWAIAYPMWISWK